MGGLAPVSGALDTAIVQPTPLPAPSAPADADVAGPPPVEQYAPVSAPINLNLPPPVDTTA